MQAHVAVPILMDRAARATLRLASRVAAELTDIGSLLARRWRIRATRRVLECLDDRTLHDIGIDRSEIPSVAATSCYGKRCRDMPLF